MLDLARFLELTGTISWWLSRHTAQRASDPRRHSMLRIEELEDRVVPTLLGQQLFPADYAWNQSIANAPVAANSAAIITHIGSSIGIHPDWGNDSATNGDSPLYGIPYNVVHGNSTASINVVIDNYPGESDIVPVPIPANAVIEGDYQNGPNPNGGGYNANQRGDSHLIVWDEDNNIAYELFGVTRPTDPTIFPNTDGVELPHTDGLWHAAQETVWNMNTDSFRSLGATSADAAGLSILAGLARPDEGLPVSQGGQGAIDHALRLTLPSGDVSNQYLYPASHMVSDSAGSTKLPFGARLRLMDTPAVNTAIASLGPEAQIIAHAMQQYGLILADIGSAMYVTGTSAAEDANNNITETWDMDDVLGLHSLTASDFQVVNLTPVVTGLSATGGGVGSTITINGQNFSGAAGHLSVFFGNTAASSVTYVSDTQITAVVPSGSGTVNVKVQSGVNETDNISDSPSANVNAPIFGYGTSAITSADQFTFSGQPISGANSTTSFTSPTVSSGATDALTIVVKDTAGNPVSGLSSGAFAFSLAGGVSTGTFGPVTATATAGTYSTAFTGTTAGTIATLTTTVSGVSLTTQPTIKVNTGAISGTTSSVNFAAPTVASGGTDLTTIVVKDAAGNAITGLASSAFAFSFIVGASSGSFGPIIETATNGTYTAILTATTAGSASTLTTSINSVPLTTRPSVTVLAPTTTLPFSDSFTPNPPANQLSSSWHVVAGSFSVATGQAVGKAASNQATLANVSAANVDVQATISLTANKQYAGLVARSSGPGENNEYFAYILRLTSTSYQARIYVIAGGAATLLSLQSIASGAGLLEFSVVGPSLKLFLNNTLVGHAQDSRLKTGSVGMGISAGAGVANFNAAAVVLPTNSIPFSDNFAANPPTNQLSSNWIEQAGNYEIQAAGGAVSQASPSDAVVAGLTALNVAVQANISLTAVGSSFGLLARYQGPGDGNTYLANVSKFGANLYKAAILKNVAGVWTQVGLTVTTSSFAGNIEFVLNGSSLSLLLDGVDVLKVTNASIASAGAVGIRATNGVIVNSFSAA